MKYEPINIISRSHGAGFSNNSTQSRRMTVQAGEAGLVDALGLRDRTAIMRAEHKSQFVRYQCGLEDGQALLRIDSLTAGRLLSKV